MNKLLELLFHHNRRIIHPGDFPSTQEHEEVYIEEDEDTRIQVLNVCENNGMYTAFCFDFNSYRAYTYTLWPHDELVVLS